MAEARTKASGDDSQARAEELLQDVSGQVDDWSDKVAAWVARAAARAREEAEDIWAEAQSVRHGRKRS
jgi:hypothetical protein